MQPFGVQELPNARGRVEPGWAYVADTGINPAQAALQPTNRKRAARTLTTNASVADHTTKQDARTLRELAQLDKDSFKDHQIPIPVRHASGRVQHGKTTPNVRKILASQKTFANHLSDAEANAALTHSQPLASPSVPSTPAVSRASPAGTPRSLVAPHLTASGKRSHKKKDPSQLLRRVSTLNATEAGTTTPLKTESSTISEAASDTAAPPEKKPILNPLPAASTPKPHHMDNEPLLVSKVPLVPTDAELAALLTAPPLSYLEACGQLTADDLSKPVRTFCTVCGYWGRVKCLKCGSRVCALECLREHQVECYTRYGA